MASTFLRGLARVGLVELDESEMPAGDAELIDLDELDRMIAAERDPGPASAAAPVSLPAADTKSGIGAIVEGEGFDKMYAAAKVPASAYPAEKLLKVLDGLKSMAPQTCKAAVLAMDAADDDWSVADSVLDAQRKTKILAARSERLDTELAGIRQRGQAEKTKRDDYLTRARETILQKITDLQQTLANETATALSEKTDFDAAVFAAEQAHQRESHRLSTEVTRLAEVPRVFAIQRGGAGDK
jgi:hypothetical protein